VGFLPLLGHSELERSRAEGRNALEAVFFLAQEQTASRAFLLLRHGNGLRLQAHSAWAFWQPTHLYANSGTILELTGLAVLLSTHLTPFRSPSTFVEPKFVCGFGVVWLAGDNPRFTSQLRPITAHESRNRNTHPVPVQCAVSHTHTGERKNRSSVPVVWFSFSEMKSRERLVSYCLHRLRKEETPLSDAGSILL
jgi:hypothetical protein